MRKPVARHEAIGPRRQWLGPRSHGRRLHAGVDLNAPPGTPVVAPIGGVVRLVVEASYGADGTEDALTPELRARPRFSRPAGWAGYGPWAILLEGDDGTWHLLAHVERVTAAVGQRVEEGLQLAVVARRGRHCHWEVRDRARPPAGWAAVEISMDPLAWQRGERRRYLDLDPPVCPAKPGRTLKTPRACRPPRTRSRR